MKKGVFLVIILFLVVSVAFLFSQKPSLSPNTSSMTERLGCVDSCYVEYNSCVDTLIRQVNCGSRTYQECRSLIESKISLNCKKFITHYTDFLNCDDVEGWLNSVGATGDCRSSLQNYATLFCGEKECMTDYEDCIDGCDLQCNSEDRHVFQTSGTFTEVRDIRRSDCVVKDRDKETAKQRALAECQNFKTPHYECPQGCPLSHSRNCEIINSGGRAVYSPVDAKCTIYAWATAKGTDIFKCSEMENENSQSSGFSV